MIIKNLNLILGTTPIFDDVSILIPEKEKIGITGVNGVGKTTFFKIILKELEPDSGNIHFQTKTRISWLPQVITDEVPNIDISVFDFLLQGRPIDKIQKRIEESYLKITLLTKDKDIEADLKKIAKLQDELDYWEPYVAESELLKLIEGMNISSSLLDQSLSSLSGGQKSKVAFAKLLYSKPELILLDEPTNHLDQDTKEYITNYLKNYEGTIYFISHDIDFLNELATKILFIDKRTHQMTLYHGNYQQFEKIRLERNIHLEKEALLQNKERIRLQGIIDKYINGNEKKANIAKDRQKKLAKLEENKITIEKNLKTANINIHQGRESTSYPLKTKDLCFKYNKSSKRNLLYKINLEIPRGEKFLIIGENGAGKSTLLKLIIGDLTPDSGEIILGPKTDIGYYAQEHERLDNEKNLIENLSDFELTDKEIRALLGRFLFTNDELFKKVKVLSLGERARLALAKLTLEKANLLILDEPTNHLDPETQKIIANNLKTFTGTMIIVSHNTAFVDQLGIKRTLILPEGRLAYYEVEAIEKYQKLNNRIKNVI